MRNKNEKNYLRKRKTTDKICGFNIIKLHQRPTSLSKRKIKCESLHHKQQQQLP